MSSKTRGTDGDRPDRRNKGLLAFHADEVLRRKIKMLAAREGTTVNALGHEAFNDLLKKYEQPPTAS